LLRYTYFTLFVKLKAFAFQAKSLDRYGFRGSLRGE